MEGLPIRMTTNNMPVTLDDFSFIDINYHANPDLYKRVNGSIDAGKQYLKLNGIWIEQTALTYLLSYQDESDFSAVLRDVPRVIYSSDLGQTSQMGISSWIKASEEWFCHFNISTTRKAEICLYNPIQLLKI